MKVPLLDLKAQYAGIKDEVREAIDEVCDSQYFILGPRVVEFEKHIAEYCGTKEAVGVSSGTDALLVALMAMEIGPGDAVLTTPYTFFATVGSIVRLGATPVFVDIDPVSFNIDPQKLKETLESFTSRFPNLTPKAMVPVHLYGQSADMDPIMNLATQYDLRVVEDACQAIGTEYSSNGKTVKVGSIGDAGCFSFFPSKNLGGFGDGGMVTTNSSELAEKMRQLRNHGSQPKYYHKIIGGNFRLDAIQAVVLDVKLKYLDSWHGGRQSNAAFYNKLFEGTKVQTPVAKYENAGLTNCHIYNQYVVRVPERDNLRAMLVEKGIGCDIYYPLSLHMQECFKSLGYAEEDFPVSEKAAAETIALPVYPEITNEMQKYVVETVLEVVGD